MKIAKLVNNSEIIGSLYIIEDFNGGGLNGGVFFSKDGQSFFKEIPLFETFYLEDGLTKKELPK